MTAQALACTWASTGPTAVVVLVVVVLVLLVVVLVVVVVLVCCCLLLVFFNLFASDNGYGCSYRHVRARYLLLTCSITVVVLLHPQKH